jgi:hypothetical protein
MNKVGNAALWALSWVALFGAGCGRHVETPLTRPQPPVRTGPAWGPEAEGLQCRLRPTKRLWNQGETLTFRLDLRNQGTRLFTFDAQEPIRADRIAVNGRWLRWPRPDTATAKLRPFAPGTEFRDLTLTVPPAMRLPLDPGRHDIRVAFVFEGLEVHSHPVAIEMARAP